MIPGLSRTFRDSWHLYMIFGLVAKDGMMQTSVVHLIQTQIQTTFLN